MGLVSGLWHRTRASGTCRDDPVIFHDSCVHVVLRMAADFRRSDRVHRIVHGWALGRILPAPACGGSLAIYRDSFRQQTADQHEVATFVMSLFFLAGGVYEIVASLWFHLQGWGWHVLSGALSMVLGGLLLAQWPIAGLWVIGFFVGIYLLVSGIDWMGIAIGLRKM